MLNFDLLVCERVNVNPDHVRTMSDLSILMFNLSTMFLVNQPREKLDL